MINIENLLNEMTYRPAKISDRYYNSHGDPVPRVTEILSTMIHSDGLMYWANNLGFKGIRYKEYMNTAANIGTEAHNHIESFLKKKLEATNNIPFQGFMLWWNSIIDRGNTIELVGSEQKIACNWFGGTYDALVRINGKLYLVDFKTSNHVTEKYFLQLAAYAYILEGMGYHIDGFIVLQLNKSEPGFNEYLLIMDVMEHYVFMQNCIKTFLSLVYAYYNLHLVQEGYKSIF